MALFNLRTPRDMLEKARREHERLGERLDIDNLFNFFVTAYHISDYIKKTGSVTQIVLEAFLQDPDMQVCRDICDSGKHLSLTWRTNPDTHVWSGCIGGAPINALPLGGGDKWMLSIGDREIDVECLASTVLSKWEQFFATNNL